MAYEGFMALSVEGDVERLEPVFLYPNTDNLVTAGKSTSEGTATFLISCSREDEAKVYITRLRQESLQELAEDPDLIRSMAALLVDTMSPLGILSPGGPTARFPFNSEEGVQELVLRHIERPKGRVELGGLLIDMPSMN